MFQETALTANFDHSNRSKRFNGLEDLLNGLLTIPEEVAQGGYLPPSLLCYTEVSAKNYIYNRANVWGKYNFRIRKQNFTHLCVGWHVLIWEPIRFVPTFPSDGIILDGNNFMFVKLRHKESNQIIVLGAVHFPHREGNDKTEAWKALLDILKTIQEGNNSERINLLVLGGDWNFCARDFRKEAARKLKDQVHIKGSKYIDFINELSLNVASADDTPGTNMNGGREVDFFVLGSWQPNHQHDHKRLDNGVLSDFQGLTHKPAWMRFSLAYQSDPGMDQRTQETTRHNRGQP